MLLILLAKDLRRAWRNPQPWLINLIIPLVITALVGMVFGGHGDNNALGKIRFAVVDEDQSVLSKMLRGAAGQNQGSKYLDPVFMERAEALRQINNNAISAVLIIPTNFTRNYLTARETVTLELIKNPAESIHPAVLEELLGVLTSTLNVLARNFNSEFPEWLKFMDGTKDYHQASHLMDRAADKIEAAKNYLDPPLVFYEKVDEDAKSNAVAAAASGSGGTAPVKKTDSTGIFGYLLLGMAAMFLLFLASNAMTDLHRELRKRTFERYQTMRTQLWPFIAGKIIFTVVILCICSAIMLGGGGLIFQIHWIQPLVLVALTGSYACFAAAFYAVLVALVPDERRAGVLTYLAGMGLGIVGGCMFPPDNLPVFLRQNITPLMPSNWFVEAARSLESGDATVAWGGVMLKFAITTVILLALAVMLFRRKFKSGLRT